MHHYYDEDEWMVVSRHQPCTACDGDLRKCQGGLCNGSSGMGLVRRPPAEVAKIKAEKARKHEDSVLAEADAIRARRACQ